MYRFLFTSSIFILFVFQLTVNCATNQGIEPGAKSFSEYLPLITNRNVGLVVNQSAIVDNVHLVDTLLSLNVHVKRIFSPEHGFRGIGDRGELIANSTDTKSGLPIISIYGNNKKPTKEQLDDIDVVVFDLQDVGVRFFTYISTLHYIIEACAENNKKLIILDRPNPNGFYVDGPVLELKNKSFVGMYPIPVVHGMTISELALMAVGEGWVSEDRKPDITIIKCENYNHDKKYILPVKPSPNLPDMRSVYLYPSLCLLEGTVVSLGRGTPYPFQMYGHPDFKEYDTVFIPESKVGASKNPVLKNQKCFGFSLRRLPVEKTWTFNLEYILSAYHELNSRDNFFTPYFTMLTGTNKLEEAIKSGMSANEIKQSWQKDLDEFKKIRKKYLLYPDFTQMQ